MQTLAHEAIERPGYSCLGRGVVGTRLDLDDRSQWRGALFVQTRLCDSEGGPMRG